jgi:heme-degrading monooxygenase HmoA
MKQVNVINFIEVPVGLEGQAIEIRERYVDYFRKQPGFVSSTFYRSMNNEDKFTFVNIVVWDSHESYLAVVNSARSNSAGENVDGMKVLGNGFPPPMVVFPGQYEVIGN